MGYPKSARTCLRPDNNDAKINKVDQSSGVLARNAVRPLLFLLLFLMSVNMEAQTAGVHPPYLTGDLGDSGVRGPAPANSAPYSVSVSQLGISHKVLKHLESAHQRFSKTDLRGANAEIRRALDLDPHCAQALTLRALIKLASRDFAGAARDADYAANLDPGDPLSFLASATAYNSLRDFQRAETAARQALRMQPDLWQARLELAKSFYGRHQFTSALRESDAAKTDFPDVHLVRGTILMNLGRTREAVEEFVTFLAEAPHDPRVGRVRRMIAESSSPAQLSSAR